MTFTAFTINLKMKRLAAFLFFFQLIAGISYAQLSTETYPDGTKKLKVIL